MYELLKYTKVRTTNSPYDKELNKDLFNKQLYTSSKSLYEQLNTNEITPKAKLANSKYENRSKYRTTPFGLFSSVSFTELSRSNNAENKYVIGGNYKVHTTIDSEWIVSLLKEVKNQNTDSLKFKWNEDAVYENSYTIYNTWSSGSKNNEYNKIDKNSILSAIKSNSGDSTNLSQLHIDLDKYNNINLPKSILIKLISKLIDGGFLITDLDDLTLIKDINGLQAHLNFSGYRYPKNLEKITELINKLNTTINEFNIDKVNEVENIMADITKSKKYLKFDSETDVKNLTLNQDLLEEKTLPLINLLSSYASKVPYQERYKADVSYFKEKYGRKKIKLLDFYKEYTLIREKHLSLTSTTNSLKDEFKFKLQSKMDEELVRSSTLDISNFSFNEFEATETTVSPTLQCCFNIENHGDQLRLSFSPYIGNIGLGRLEGRFSYIDSAYYERIKEIERNKFLESGLDVITVKYLPKEPHYYNIMTDDESKKPNLQFSSSSNCNSVVLEDIYITVYNDQFFLSINDSNGKERHVTFQQYNVSNVKHFSPPIVADLFLWSNYYNNIFYMLHDLQTIRDERIHFPQITFNDIEILPESWLLNNKVSHLKSKKEYLEYFNAFKTKYSLPNQLFVRRGDMRLLLNINEKEDMDIILDTLMEKHPFNIYLEKPGIEFSDSLTIDKENNKYLSEFILNFVKSNNEGLITPPLSNKGYENVHVKTSSWIHYDIYLPFEYQEDFLRNYLHEKVHNMFSEGLIEDFFFIRYFDDKHHIRIRFHLKDFNVIKSLDESFNMAIRSGDISDFSLGRYEPELDRYGGPTVIQYAEEFFGIDSRVALSHLRLGAAGPLDKVDVPVFLALTILNRYTTDLEIQLNIMTPGNSNKEFSKEYRDNRNKYLKYNNLIRSGNEASFTHINLDLLKEYNSKLMNYYSALNNHDIEKQINVVRSLIHMMCIRNFGIKSREEDLINNMIWRLIKQTIAMEKYSYA